MKTIRSLPIILALSVGVVALNGAPAETTQKAPQKCCAVEKAKSKTRSAHKVAAVAQPQRTVALNGSITDGPNQLIVITDEAIRRRGYATLGQTLARGRF